ncbi:predicted protein, partial [Nematostella vectensis]
NTYKMVPDKKIACDKIRDVIRKHLRFLETTEYEVNRCREISKLLSNRILKDLKLLGFPRYKFVSSVCIGQMLGQSVRIASRCVWDTESDNFVSESYESLSLFAVGTVFAVYRE